jgi:hypothetical protein
MLYTKLSPEDKDKANSPLKLSYYCKNCGFTEFVEDTNKTVYKRNYENDFIADKILNNKYSIYDSALPRLNLKCVNTTCITNQENINQDNTLFYNEVPEDISDEELIANVKQILNALNLDSSEVDVENDFTILRLQLTMFALIINKEDIKRDTIKAAFKLGVSKLEKTDKLVNITNYDKFEKPKNEVLYIKYDPDNMKYLYQCVNCGTSWFGNN